jgi:hypothetical protein
MTYFDLILAAHHRGFERVERDDRLLDVLSGQTREKGVELWVRWLPQDVLILRVKYPFNPNQISVFKVPTAILEKTLLNNQTLDLTLFPRSVWE